MSPARFLSATSDVHFTADSNLVELACEPGDYRSTHMQAPVRRSDEAVTRVDAMPDSQLRITDTIQFYVELLLVSEMRGLFSFLQAQVPIDIFHSGGQCNALQ